MSWSGSRVRAARAAWAVRLPLPCAKCGKPVTADKPWTVGHVVARVLGGSETDPANQWPEHPRCNFREGQAIGTARRRARRAPATDRMPAEHTRGIRGL